MDSFGRVYAVRKAVGLSQSAFAEKLGASRDEINNIERDRLARPEQKEPLLRLVCEIYNVNYNWLTTGNGEMFKNVISDAVSRFANEVGLSQREEKAIRNYLTLPALARGAVEKYLSGIFSDEDI